MKKVNSVIDIKEKTQENGWSNNWIVKLITKVS